MVRKLYVGGLPFETTDAELRVLFEQAGKVDSAVVITDSVSGRSKGFGCVEMSTNAGGRRAISELNGKVLGGTDDNAGRSTSSPSEYREAGRPSTPLGLPSPTVVGSGSEAVIPDTSPGCSHSAHHWSIGRPDGPTSGGVCKWCNARRDFINEVSWRYSSQGRQVRKRSTDEPI
jgi:RNA recognition motif-containing protein